MTAAAAVTIFAVAYVLIATEWIHRTAVALGGAGLMLLLHVTTSEKAFFSIPRSRRRWRSPAWTGTSSSCCWG